MSEIENVRVFVRIRPKNRREIEENHQTVVLYDTKQNLVSLQKSYKKTYKFDGVFGQDSQQLDLYKVVASPIVEKVLNGYNGTIFAYGQTGTGKTYTMCGNFLEKGERGITPNAFDHIFTKIAQSDQQKSFVVTATYLEIYNEEVRDLLSNHPEKKLTIKERPDVGVYVKDLMGFPVHSVESIVELLMRGNKNRVTRSTMMNDVSSRSHAIFTVTIESRFKEEKETRIGKLNLVDLAGSERASRTGAQGDRLKEASNINLSLSVLGNVISALVDGKSTHIPYRNSKLTRLLQDSLGGNSKTSMISMISPCELDFEETSCTLRYAARVKQIKNYAKINVETKGLIEGFEKEIAELQAKIVELSQNPVEKQTKFLRELQQTEREKKDLEEKINLIQKKILTGGLNLLSEQAEKQGHELQNTRKELTDLDLSHRRLLVKLENTEAENLMVKEKFTTLREEEENLTLKLRKIQSLLNEFREEFRDKEHEYQREMEQLFDNNRLLMRETQLAALLLDNYVPMEYREKIEQNLIWNMESQEFQMRGVAYTGNNMRKHKMGKNDAATVPIRPELKPVYHKYAEKRKIPKSNFSKYALK